jgi:hypothetical protein
MIHQVNDDNGIPTGATFEIENRGGRLSIVFHSRGTTEGTRSYRAGLVEILQRLADENVWTWDVCVETRTTKELSRAKRRIWNPDGPDNTLQDAVRCEGAEAIRKRLHTRAAKVGRPPGAKGGGNGTKRIRIYLHPEESHYQDADGLAELLTGPVLGGPQ